MSNTEEQRAEGENCSNAGEKEDAIGGERKEKGEDTANEERYQKVEGGGESAGQTSERTF